MCISSPQFSFSSAKITSPLNRSALLNLSSKFQRKILSPHLPLLPNRLCVPLAAPCRYKCQHTEESSWHCCPELPLLLRSLQVLQYLVPRSLSSYYKTEWTDRVRQSLTSRWTVPELWILLFSFPFLLIVQWCGFSLS